MRVFFLRGYVLDSVKLKTLKVGICGYGTVGSGTLALLQGNAKQITRKTGVEIEVYRVASRSLQVAIAGVTHSGTDPFAVASDEEVEVVVEAIEFLLDKIKDHHPFLLGGQGDASVQYLRDRLVAPRTGKNEEDCGE